MSHGPHALNHPMHRITNTGRVNLGHLFWLRSLAIIGQLTTIAVVQIFYSAKLPLPAMLLVVALEMFFNGLTWLRVARAQPETNVELFGQMWVDLGALSALLFLSGGSTNPFVTLYLPSLAISAAILPWTMTAWLALFAVSCYALLSYNYVPLNIENPSNLFDYFRTGLWVNFMVSVGLIGWFVARMSRALRVRDAALADAQQRHLRDERAVALGVQAATVAHEMGTPLSTIAMLSEELRDSAAHDRNLAPYAADFELLEQQMALCTSALARLRSRATGPSNRQPLREWLASFIEQWRLRHPQVKFEHAGKTPESMSIDDSVAIGQILTILLDNAARASSELVTLQASAERVEGVQMVRFDICDRGPGIPPALRSSLGAAPVDSTQGGHGVGLYLAFAAAARLQGSIELAADQPRGTRAILRLPNFGASPADEARTESSGAA